MLRKYSSTTEYEASFSYVSPKPIYFGSRKISLISNVSLISIEI